MPRQVAVAELHQLIGQEIGVSAWLEVTQARVNLFADATGDHQWIHVDVVRATREMGGPIVHGYLTLSLLAVFAADILEVTGVERALNYGCNRVRFPSMVRVGKRLRMRQTVLAVEPRSGGTQVVSECAIEIEDEARPACVAETVVLYYAA